MKKIKFYKRMLIEILETLCTICLFCRDIAGRNHYKWVPTFNGHFYQLKDYSSKLRDDLGLTSKDRTSVPY